MSKAAKRSSKATPKKPNGALSEAQLIEACVNVAACLAAYHSGFTADPDGNNKTAARTGSKFMSMRKQELRRIIATPATTAQGLSAKARIAGALIEDDLASLSADSHEFILGFAADVKAFTQKIGDDEWRDRVGLPTREQDVIKAARAV
jgi:hypothetical protein